MRKTTVRLAPGAKRGQRVTVPQRAGVSISISFPVPRSRDAEHGSHVADPAISLPPARAHRARLGTHAARVNDTEDNGMRPPWRQDKRSATETTTAVIILAPSFAFTSPLRLPFRTHVRARNYLHYQILQAPAPLRSENIIHARDGCLRGHMLQVTRV